MQGSRRSTLLPRELETGAATRDTRVAADADVPGNAPLLGAADSVPRRYHLLWQHRVTGDRALWPMLGTAREGSSIPLVQEDTVWEMVASADFDGEGVDEVLFQNRATGQRGLWHMRNLAYQSWIPFSDEDPAWRMVSASDFTGDGQPDILFEHRTTGERGWWRMQRTGFVEWLWLPHEPRVAWRMVGSADFTGDGKPDILFQNTQTGQRGIWELDGTTWVNWTSLTTVPVVWEMVAIHDANGDGHPDILFQNNNTGARGWWIMERMQYRGWLALGTVEKGWDIVGAWRVRDSTPPMLSQFNEPVSASRYETSYPVRADPRFGPIALTYRILAIDEESGLGGAKLTMRPPSGGAVAASCDVGAGYPPPRVYAWLECSLLVAQGTPMGEYEVSLEIVDAAGNTVVLDAAALRAHSGFLSARVLVAPGPELFSWKVTPDTIDLASPWGRTIHVEMGIRDSAGLRDGQLSATAPGPFGGTIGTGCDLSRWTLVSGTSTDGVFACDLVVPWTTVERYSLALDVQDKALSRIRVSTAALAAAGLTATIPTKRSPDAVAPSFTFFDLSPLTADLDSGPATIRFTVGATDVGVGVDYVNILVDRPDSSGAPSQWQLTCKAELAAGSRLDGRFDCPLELWQGVRTGTYRVNVLELLDGSRNKTVVAREQLAQLGHPTTFSLSKSDTTPPVLLSLVIDDIIRIGTDSLIRVQVEMEDDITGYNYMLAMVYQVDGNADSYIGFCVSGRTIEEGSPPASRGERSCAMRAPATPGDYYLSSLELTDRAGNSRWLMAPELDSLGFPTRIRAVPAAPRVAAPQASRSRGGSGVATAPKAAGR